MLFLDSLTKNFQNSTVSPKTSDDSVIFVFFFTSWGFTAGAFSTDSIKFIQFQAQRVQKYTKYYF